jgi:hypothetical protein
MLVVRWPAAEDRWTLLLTRHPDHLRWSPPGGHVRPGENPAEAARRAVFDIGGWSTVLIAPEHQTPSPPGFGAGGELSVPIPWWITQQFAEPPCPERHLHVDHVYVGLVDAARPVIARTQHPPGQWATLDQLTGLNMTDGSRRLASDILRRAAEGTLGPRPGAVSGVW